MKTRWRGSRAERWRATDLAKAGAEMIEELRRGEEVEWTLAGT